MGLVWLGFWAVGIIWGSSFMLIRVGVELVHPVHLVLVRVGIGAIGLCLVSILWRQKIPRDWRTLAGIAVVGVGNVAIPFTLISWGEQTIDSGLASVLQSTAALFALVVAHFAFQDERITAQKTAGLVLGFLGVVVLASRSWQDGTLETGNLAGQMAVVLASLCYAIFTSVGRKILQSNVAPIVLAALSMLVATFVEAGVLLVGVWGGWMPATVPSDLPGDVLVAILTLGFLNTFIAYLLYYEIVKRLGVAKATMVTYVVPVVGLILGVVFLNELLDARLLLGAGMIFTGIGIVNLRYFGRLNGRWARRGYAAR